MTTAEELVRDIRWKAMRLRGEHTRTSASHLNADDESNRPKIEAAIAALTGDAHAG